MSILRKTNFGKKNSAIVPPDFTEFTVIGGVSGTINSPVILVNYLSGITESDISEFTIEGDNIKFKAAVNYVIYNAFNGNSDITFYNDAQKKCTALYSNTFQNCPNLKYAIFDGVLETNGFTFSLSANLERISFQSLETIGGANFINGTSIKEAYFPNCTSVVNQGLQQATETLFIYLPLCTSLGGTVGNDSVLNNCNINAKLYVHPSLETANTGNPDGDLTYASGRGAEINYVTNFNSPEKITDLSYSNGGGSYVFLNFTPPTSGSPIDFYEVYIDGIYSQEIYNSGDAIFGFFPGSYGVQIIAVDSNYNKSELSNYIEFTISGQAILSTVNLLAYLKMNTISSGETPDELGNVNAQTNNVTVISSGKIDNAINFPGNGNLNLGQSLNLNNNSTVAMWIKLTSKPTKWCPFQYHTYNTWGTWNGQTNGQIILYYGTGGGGFGQFSTNTLLADGVWYHVALVRDSSNGKQYWYINGELDRTASFGGVISPSGNLLIGQGYSGYVNGNIDEIAIYDRACPSYIIKDLYNNGNGITY